MSGLLFIVFGIVVWSFVWFFLVLRVEKLFGLVPFKTCPLVRFGVCSPLVLLFCYGDVRRRRFSLCPSLSLSLSGAGETQTPTGLGTLGFPL